MILRGEVSRGDIITVDVEDDKIVVDAVTPSRPTAPVKDPSRLRDARGAPQAI